MKQRKAILIIMDGWGIADDPEVSAIHHAQTPFYDRCLKECPHIELEASGLAVGLPEGQMGNSEVGHTNIGAGRVVYQMLAKLTQELKNGGFENRPVFQALMNHCKASKKPLHLLGLLSDGGVHSHINHLKSIISILAKNGLEDVFVHVFTDGRDSDPEGGLAYVEELEAHLSKENCGKIATIIGRYYAMDRDLRWERVRQAYDLLVAGKGEDFESASQALKASYAAGVTDEFVKPICLVEDGKIIARVQDGDGLLFYNFRTDRGRELTRALSQEDFSEHGMVCLNLEYTTLTRYDNSFKDVEVLYEKEKIVNGMGEWLDAHGKTQLRIAETEKYPHVTFFFNGGREQPLDGESYELCPSPKVATYDLQPEMSAFDIRDKIILQLTAEGPDFVCLNFANPDMVGHTGDMQAAIKACETVDACTQSVAEAAAAAGYKVIITADHGNCDRMRNPDGSPHTAHTTVQVPCILIDPEKRFTFKDKNMLGKLADLAPTFLRMMGVQIPKEMTGDVLVDRIEN